ncbi:Aats-val [Bugula neritina]|uniref:Aats-val n=1 Tax=Bugula neritina TaxID=10212 RepID=A0A7J7K6K6_BUGNE|nr:Aats-val [Bugula neritina]
MLLSLCFYSDLYIISCCSCHSCVYSDDGLFLRQLILDGHWDDTLEFMQPLEGIEGYNKKECHYLVYKHKYLELLCIKHDPGPLQNHEFTLDEVISCLTELEALCDDRKEYDNLCFLLTLPTITADKEYKDWNPSIVSLVKKFVGLEKRPPPHSFAKHDRLLNLVTKGILYEMCVQLCTSRAYADLSLVSWLQKVPAGTFACPFEKKSLKLKVDRLEKPTLEAVWGEQLLSTPIKPKQFPHTSIPARTRSSQLISQSMMAMYDGLSSNLHMHTVCEAVCQIPVLGNMSGAPLLSRSYAHSPTTKFLLTNSLRSDRKSNPMNQSVERLFSGSGRSTPRPLNTSPLLKEEAKKNSRPEVISPPPPATEVTPLTPTNPKPSFGASHAPVQSSTQLKSQTSHSNQRNSNSKSEVEITSASQPSHGALRSPTCFSTVQELRLAFIKV